MPTRRQARLNELLQQELSVLIPGSTSDPRLDDVNITRVETTQDMGTAKVYFTLADAAEEAEEAAEAAARTAIEALEHAQGYLRSELANLGLRRLPRLVFARDKAFESGQRVFDLLEAISRDQASRPPEPEGEASEPAAEPSDPATEPSENEG
jgi:ribosome-binding factor A